MHYYFKSQVLKFIIRIQLMVLLCKQGPERTVTSTDQFACNTCACAIKLCISRWHDNARKERHSVVFKCKNRREY